MNKKQTDHDQMYQEKSDQDQSDSSQFQKDIYD